MWPVCIGGDWRRDRLHRPPVWSGLLRAALALRVAELTGQALPDVINDTTARAGAL